MFDVIGKRRYFYLVSLLITIPGLFFILLTPFTSYGLQFTIDYTGGTTWEIRFQDPNVTPDQVEAVFASQGLDATAVQTGDGFIAIKTEQIAGVDAIAPSPSPSASSPTASGSPGASASAGGQRQCRGKRQRDAQCERLREPERQPEPEPERLAECFAVGLRFGDPVRLARRIGRRLVLPAPPSGNTKIPTEGKLGEVAAALQSELGPIAEQRSLTTIGAVVSSDLIFVAVQLIIVGSIGIMIWITYRFRDVKFGVTALVALLHDVIVVIGFFAILGTFFRVQIDALFVTAMLTVIGFSRARHDRGL